MLELNATQPPGIDPDGPAATPQDTKDWAAEIDPALTTAMANSPAELVTSFTVLRSVVDAAKQGTTVPTDDPDLNAALNKLSASVHDNCGFQTLDIVNDKGVLTGAPTSLKAGPVAIEFTNSTDPATAGYVLLIARINDGETAPLADIVSGDIDISDVGDVLTAAQPIGAEPAYATATLTPGHYVLASPLGTPPTFTGIIAAEFDVA